METVRVAEIVVTVTPNTAYRMPTNPRWLLAIPDALTQLETSDRPLLIRRDLEQLFGISKPQAAILMRRFGAERTGHLRTLTREQLICILRALQQDATFTVEIRSPRAFMCVAAAGAHCGHPYTNQSIRIADASIRPAGGRHPRPVGLKCGLTERGRLSSDSSPWRRRSPTTTPPSKPLSVMEDSHGDSSVVFRFADCSRLHCASQDRWTGAGREGRTIVRQLPRSAGLCAGRAGSLPPQNDSE